MSSVDTDYNRIRKRKEGTKMTQKQILAIAASEDAMWILKEIADIQRNMCHKTIYERKTATKEMKSLAKQLQEIIEG